MELQWGDGVLYRCALAGLDLCPQSNIAEEQQQVFTLFAPGVGGGLSCNLRGTDWEQGAEENVHHCMYEHTRCMRCTHKTN